MLEPSSVPSFDVRLARDIAAHLADGVTEPIAMLERLHQDRSYRASVTLELVARQMRTLTGDTTALARQIVRAQSAPIMLDVIQNGEPRDKIQVLAKWGPEPNVEDNRGSLTIVVGGHANVQINLGPALSPPEHVQLADKSTG